MGKHMVRVCATLALFFAAGVQAAIFECPLPGLSGSYGGPTAHTADFNLGQQFASIDHAWLQLSGTFESGQYHYFNEATGTYVDEGCPGFFTVLKPQNQGYVDDTFRPSSLLPFEPTPPNETFTLVSNQMEYDAFLASERELMLQGWGNVSLSLITSWGMFSPQVIVPAEANITAAMLVIDGTPIPEPMTLGLLAIGGAALLRRRK